jgi:hypothetical protein
MDCPAFEQGRRQERRLRTALVTGLANGPRPPSRVDVQHLTPPLYFLGDFFKDFCPPSGPTRALAARSAFLAFCQIVQARGELDQRQKRAFVPLLTPPRDELLLLRPVAIAVLAWCRRS